MSSPALAIVGAAHPEPCGLRGKVLALRHAERAPSRPLETLLRSVEIAILFEQVGADLVEAVMGG